MGWGISLPVRGIPLRDQEELIRSLPALGYTDAWTGETSGVDAFTPLVLASQWAPELRLGPAIVPAATRGPALIAMQAAAMADLAPGRFVLGVGSSSPVITEAWNAVPFAKPFQRTRDLVRFLRKALAGERVDEEFETFTVRGFRLDAPPETPPPIMVAALRPSMLRMAVTEGDGAITNWLSSDDVLKVRAEVGDEPEVVGRIFVLPTEDPEVARRMARRNIAAYLTVPAYAAFHTWLGRGDALAPMQAHWAAGDRRAALAAIPDEVVDQLFLWGSHDQIRAGVQRYLDNGLSTAVLMVTPVPSDGADAGAAAAEQATVIRSLAPPNAG
jgi:probable F420-dependent oxidoreductase